MPTSWGSSMTNYSMGRADCIGQGSAKRGYIFVMRSRLLLFSGLMVMTSALSLKADPGDVENSHDYPGFPRLSGYIITDYDEDNPADFDFPVARPLPIDSNHVEIVHITGHRFVIRYELGIDAPAPSLLQTQQAFEKLAAAGGFSMEKTGAVGDVSETFRGAKGGLDIWVCVVPSIRVNILTIVEAKGETPPRVVASVPGAILAPPEVPEDLFYTSLMKNGRVVLPLTFLPSKPDLDADSQPVIDRVATMMKSHPSLFFEIVGNTDDVGDVEANLRLSSARAATVRALLIANHVDKKQVSAMGLGGSRPLASNQTEEGREKNRRIELVLRSSAAPSEPEPDNSPEETHQ